MKHLALIAAWAIAGLCPAVAFADGTNRIEATALQPAFGHECETVLISAIDKAEPDIRVAIFCLTRDSIADALIQAVARGVTVSIKYDARQYEQVKGMRQAISKLRAKKIPCKGIKLAGDNSAMHHKFMVIDSARVVTGSYNYTYPATEENSENLVVIDSPELAKSYLVEFEELKSTK